MSCKPAATKQDNAATTTIDSTAAKNVPIVATSGIPCSMTGKLVEKFEQNNALFERLKNEAKEMEWLKVSTKDGKCFTIDSIGEMNHYNVVFEDWDKDGMKDRINHYKWDSEVCLFDKSTNNFTRCINGRFNGDQWDLDKSKNLKYQFLENKMGGIFELYQLTGNNKKIISQVDFAADYDNNGATKIQIRKNIVIANDDVKFDTLKIDSQLSTDIMPNDEDGYGDKFIAKTKKSLEAYWKKNLAEFMK